MFARAPSAEGSGTRTPPAYAPLPPLPPPHPRFFPPRLHPRPPPPQYCFDAARFASDASKPRYLDVERERLVTRWLAEANEALVRRERPPRYKPRSSDRRPGPDSWIDRPEPRRPSGLEWADNFLLGRRNGSVEPEDDFSDSAMLLKDFVDRFSLPRVVRIESDDKPVLLYRVLEAHRRVEAVQLSGKKGKIVGKPLHIPDSYDAEANEALVRRERPPRYKPRSSDRRPGPDSWIDRPEPRRPSGLEWADNFLLGRRNGSVEPEDDFSDSAMLLKDFVDRFSLPRVVRIESDDKPVLLYRVLEAHRRVEAVQLSGKKGKIVGKPLHIPDSYDGWFSVCGRRGGPTAQSRGSFAALVRARAFALVSPRALPAYRARPTPPESGRTVQYERTVARAGTPLRLAGVFADGSKAKAPKYAQLIDPQSNELFVPLNTKGELYEVCPEELTPVEHAEAEAGAQISPGAAARAHRIPHLLSLCPLPARVKLLTGTIPIEMAHDIGDDLLLRVAVTEPVLVMCTLPEYGSNPSSPTKPMPDMRHHHTKETLKLLPLNSPVKVRRTQLGYESEKRMFLSSRLQKALTFCQLNVDNWIRQISYAGSPITGRKTVEDLLKEEQDPSGLRFEKERKFTLQGLKIDTSKLFGKSDKVLKDIPDETEGSIIFLSKNELEHMNYDVYSDEDTKDDTKEDEKNTGSNNEQEQFANEKMQVFREDSGHPKRTKWFKHLKLLKSTEKLDDKSYIPEFQERYKDVRDPFDPLGEKHSSIERYQDMAKLIEDRFGAAKRNETSNDHTHSYKSLTTTSSSDMGISQCSSSNQKKTVLTKSVSVQTGMPDSPYGDKEIHIKHGRKNRSVDQINYCGSMESDASSSRKLKSLDENMLKKTSANKSTSHLEKRQRIQPDLIPEKAMIKSESFNQIQSCEEINMFGIGSLYNDTDFEINYKQHSYITEKLCSEFHVKTKKVLSKSTSNLLNQKKTVETKKDEGNSNSMPTKCERTHEIERFERVNFRKTNKPRAPTPKLDTSEESPSIDISDPEPEVQSRVRRSISAIQKRKLPVIEDLPYGQVADAVQISDEKVDSDTNSDNIYAEICNPKTDDESYENTDILATDPVISNVKKEVIIRNDERAKQMLECQDSNPFRHIEVVVIEKNSDVHFDTSSVTSSEYDDIGESKNDVSISIDSWERDKNNTSSSHSKVHAIRLEITSNIDEIDVDKNKLSLESKDLNKLSKNELSFSNSIHFNGTFPNEAIYDTLK